MQIKKLSIKPKLVSMLLAGTITSTTLVGCGNMKVMDNEFKFNKAIIFNEDNVLIVDIYKYIVESSDMQYKIILNDGTCFTTSINDTKLVNELEDGITAEEIARSIVGEDIQINYLENIKVKTKKKE